MTTVWPMHSKILQNEVRHSGTTMIFFTKEQALHIRYLSFCYLCATMPVFWHSSQMQYQHILNFDPLEFIFTRGTQSIHITLCIRYTDCVRVRHFHGDLSIFKCPADAQIIACECGNPNTLAFREQRLFSVLSPLQTSFT